MCRVVLSVIWLDFAGAWGEIDRAFDSFVCLDGAHTGRFMFTVPPTLCDCYVATVSINESERGERERGRDRVCVCVREISPPPKKKKK